MLVYCCFRIFRNFSLAVQFQFYIPVLLSPANSLTYSVLEYRYTVHLHDYFSNLTYFIHLYLYLSIFTVLCAVSPTHHLYMSSFTYSSFTFICPLLPLFSSLHLAFTCTLLLTPFLSSFNVVCLLSLVPLQFSYLYNFT